MLVKKTNSSGTMSTTFSIGKRGPTIHQGAADPNATNRAGANGDLYVMTGSSPRLYQYRAGLWMDLAPPKETTSYRRTFANGDLAGGLLSIAHNLNEDFPVVDIYDNGRQKIMPDNVYSIDANNLTISVASFGNLSGNWIVVIRK